MNSGCTNKSSMHFEFVANLIAAAKDTWACFLLKGIGSKLLKTLSMASVGVPAVKKDKDHGVNRIKINNHSSHV